MKRSTAIRIFVCISLILFSASTWAREDEAVEAAAGSLFTEALANQEKGNYSDAADLYEDLVDDFPGASFAPTALFNLGECLQHTDDLYDAYITYQSILDDYPGQGSLTEIQSRQFQIGEIFLAGRSIKFLFITTTSGLTVAEEIFETIVKTAPFSRIAPSAQFNLAFSIQQDGRYKEAEIEYDTLLKTYAGSEEVKDAYFQKAICAYKLSRGPDYEQSDTRRALKLLQFFKKRYPSAEQMPRVEVIIEELVERLADREYQIGRYYEGEDDPIGAISYYQEVVTKYTESRLAADAQARIDKLTPAALKQRSLIESQVKGALESVEAEEAEE